MTLRKLTAGCILGLAALTPVSSAHANLVTNGGFEDGLVAWNVTNGFAGSVSVIAQPHTGQLAALFEGGSLQDHHLSQIVPIDPSIQNYTLEFYIQNLGVGEDSLRVLQDGQTIHFVEPIDTPLEEWFYISIPMTTLPNQPQLDLQFVGRDSVGFLLDDISITAIPEPATLALLALGAPLALTRRRR